MPIILFLCNTKSYLFINLKFTAMDKKSILKVLLRVKDDLQNVVVSDNVLYNSAFYAYVSNASYSVAIALNHIKELSDATD